MEDKKQKNVGKLDSFFGVSKAGSTIKVEVLAGIATFLAMAYILTVNPNSMLWGGTADVRWSSVFIATALGAVIGTLLMALLAKMPLAQASGMGLNSMVGSILGGAFGFTFSFGNAMLLILISGIIFLLLSVIPAGRDKETKKLITLREYLELDEVHLLGQSWGGMLAIEYISDCDPQGVKSVVLSSTLSSSKLWSDELHNEINHFEPEVINAIYEAEKNNDYSGEACNKANARIMSIFSSANQGENPPEFLKRKRVFGALAYNTAWGPNEYTPLGNLKDYDYTSKLDTWNVPALVVSGTNDLCRPLVAKTMADHIPGARWELFANCRHSCYLDDTPRYLKMLREWLNEHD